MHQAEGDITPRAVDQSVEDLVEDPKKEGKNKKRGLFGFGKKKTEETDTSKSPLKTISPATTPVLSRDTSKMMTSTSQSTTSPIYSEHPFVIPSSPGRGLSSSPRMSSPAGSQIFERDVQDSTVLLPNSPAIPAHITTENHIPPVLDASSEAITDDHLDPDSVEIITHSSHQPAAFTVTGVSPMFDQASASWADELVSFNDRDDSASNYGSFDTTDVRRLSFISFADVVQAEQAGFASHGGNRDSMHLTGLTSLSSMGMNRSPSPIRSPVSSQGPGTSPPTSKSGSIKGLDMSPSRKPLGSPTSTHHNLSISGELNIETMSQALRRTGSADLSGVRSFPNSPVEGPSR
jgi:hypothetical protein